MSKVSPVQESYAGGHRRHQCASGTLWGQILAHRIAQDSLEMTAGLSKLQVRSVGRGPTDAHKNPFAARDQDAGQMGWLSGEEFIYLYYV